MGIPYDPTKPAMNDKPTNDQPTMQSNFSSIKTLIDIDHVDFSSASYGQHLQVTFGSNNIPGIFPTSPPILFTNNDAGSVPQLFYYAGQSGTSATQYYTSGSTMALGGIILKWGTATVSGGPTAVDFSSAFPNACQAVVATAVNSGTNANNYVYVSNFTTMGFNATGVLRTATNQATSTPFYYIAIGN